MLARSKSRPIEVDGVSYRWAVSEGRTLPVLLLVQADSGGRRLERELQRELEGFFWLPGRRATRVGPVTPSWVREFVRIARAAGWDPDEPGEPYRVRLG